MNIYENQDFIPMLLGETKEPFNDENFIFELKFDGTRTLIFAEPNKITIKNKRGEKLNDRYPELLSISKLVKTKVIFDGEIVLIVNGKPSFKKLQERALLKNKIRIDYYAKNYPVIFVVYDILYENKNLTNLPLIERKKILEKYNDTNNFVKTIYIKEKGIEIFKKVVEENLEGVVAKKINSLYKINKRNKDWIKIKNLQDDDYYICGYKEENNSVLASLLLATKENDILKFIGTVTIGKNNPEFILIKEVPKIKKPNFLKEGYEYIMPKLECTVMFMEKTNAGHLRQPIYKGLKY